MKIPSIKPTPLIYTTPHFKGHNAPTLATMAYEDKRRKIAGVSAVMMLLSAVAGISKPSVIEVENDNEIAPVAQVEIKEEKKPARVRKEAREEIVIIEKTPKTTKGEDMVNFAMPLIGLDEKGVEEVCGYDLPDGQWCAAFVKYIADTIYKDNLPDWYTQDGYNKCSDVLYYAKENGCAFDDYNKAKAGDIVIFNIGKKEAAHMGLVVSVENDILKTVEGNATKDYIVTSKTYDLIKNPEKINSFVRISGEEI